MECMIKNTVFIIGNKLGTFSHFKDKKIKKSNIPICELKNEGLIKINHYTLVNARLVIKRLKSRHIQLMDESVHKVSRASWRNFIGLPE